MSERYVLTVASCNCDSESIYFDLTDEEKALLDRINAKFDTGHYGYAIQVDTPAELASRDMGKYDIESAESAEQRLAIKPEGAA